MKNEFLSKTGKLIKGFLFLLLFAVCFSSAEGAQAEELVIGNVTAHENSISVPIIAESDFTDVTDITLNINYDENLLSYQGHTVDQLPSNTLANSPTPGRVKITWNYFFSGMVTESFNEGDVLMYLNFEVISADSVITKMTFVSPSEAGKKTGIIPSVIFTDGIIILNPESIIIDHTCTDLSKIPDYWLEQAKNLTIHYAHTSHGSQINSGAQYVETYIDPVKYSFARRASSSEGLPAMETPPALRMYDGNPPETYIQPDDY